MCRPFVTSPDKPGWGHVDGPLDPPYSPLNALSSVVFCLSLSDSRCLANPKLICTELFCIIIIIIIIIIIKLNCFFLVIV